MSSDIGPDIREDDEAQAEPLIEKSEATNNKIKPELLSARNDLPNQTLTKDQQAKKEAKEAK